MIVQTYYLCKAECNTIQDRLDKVKGIDKFT